MNKKFLLYSLISRLNNKASQSSSNFFIAAAGFSKNGNLIGIEMNGKNNIFSASRRGAGKHAEASLIKKYGKKIDTIYLYRCGNSKDHLPIDPCQNCAKIAKHMGIKIIPLYQKFDLCSNYEKRKN